MEDILDKFLVHIEGGGKPAEEEGLLRWLAEKVANMFKSIKERRKIASAIEEIKKRLQEMADRSGRYTVENIEAKPTSSSRDVDPRLKAMYKEAAQIIGIDKSRGDLMTHVQAIYPPGRRQVLQQEDEDSFSCWSWWIGQDHTCKSSV